MSKTKSQLFPFMIGADPEFLIFHGARALDASSIIQSFLSNKKDLVLERMGYKYKNYGVVGWDGASSTGELRPSPSANPQEVVNNLFNLINKIHEYIPTLDYSTLSIGSPTGGHILFDLPERFRTGNDEIQKEINRIKKITATFLMPIFASEHRVSSTGRSNSGYGRADDIRFSDDINASKMLIEVRGLSAEWITSPKIAKATIAYLAVVFHEIINNNKEMIKNETILKTQSHIEAIQKLMLSDLKMLERAIIRTIAKEVRKFELYPQFKNEIEYILKPEKVYAEKEKLGWNIMRGWNFIKDIKKITKKDILSEKKVKDIIKTLDQSAVENSFDIPYNDDYNVQLFVKAITDRIAAFKWRHTYEYFLFGLKKGIDGFAAMKIQDETFYSIPTNNNKKTTKNSCTRMASRFKDKSSNAIRLDPKTGKIRKWGHNQIIIGIPYGMRTDNNPKELLELIWNIENKKIESKNINDFVIPEIEETQKEAEPFEIKETIERAVHKNTSMDLNTDQINNLINNQ